jgi:hypothetical protein
LPRSQTRKTQYRKIDCTTSEKEYEQLLFPVSAIFNYAQWREGFQKYWSYEPEKLALARKFELEIVKRFEHYQLPIIQLRPELSKQQGIPSSRYNCLLNRTPLRKDTNRFIGSQPPSVYLARLVEQHGVSRNRLDEILRSHSIEPQTLWNDDFEAFLKSRSENLSLDLLQKYLIDPFTATISSIIN